MNCEKATELILEARLNEPELKAHLLKCQRCASLANDWSALAPARPAPLAPPLALDLKICTAAANAAQAARMRRRFVKIVSGFAAAAAAVAITISLSLYAPVPQKHASVQTTQTTTKADLSWDAVALNAGLLKLSSDIDNASSSLVITHHAEPVRTQTDDAISLQAMSVEVPDFIT